MKTLYILRHAKSSWEFEELSDHDRPLNKRGREDAILMGQELTSRKVDPELILSSSAVRAISTATLLGKELGYDPEKILIDDRIYGASKKMLLEVVQNAPADVKRLMLVGHNEALTEFANMLSPQPLASLPTTGMVALKFDCESWYELSSEQATLEFYDFPKNYK